MGCKAHIVICEYILYPEFNVPVENLTDWKLRMIREEKLKSLQNAVTSGAGIKTTTRYYVSLPTEEASSPSDTSDRRNAQYGTVNAS